MEMKVWTDYDRAAVADVCTIASQFAGRVLNGVGLVRSLMPPGPAPVPEAVLPAAPPAPEVKPPPWRRSAARVRRCTRKTPPSAVEAAARRILAEPETPRPAAAPKAPAGPVKAGSIKEAIRAACLQCPAPFTAAELRDWVKNHDPETYRRMGKSTLSVCLIALRQVMVIEDGPEKNGRSTWRPYGKGRAS
jgi:hypothetical protein